MKLAGLHCRIAKWWALNVFKDLIEEELQNSNFSDIKIFTSYSELESLSINNKNIKIITALPKRLNSFLYRNSKRNILLFKQIFDYRNLIVFYPILMKVLSWKIKKYNPNNILISSFAIAKNIDQCKTIKKWSIIASSKETSNSSLIKRKPNTTLYLHSPMQYIRDHNKEYEQKLRWRKGRLFKKIIPRLKKRDLQYTNYDKIYSNSKYTKNLAKKIYNIESEVKYPKLNQNYFNIEINKNPKNYIICVWRVVKFVREIDLIIKVFNKIWYPLIVIWNWPDENELKNLAKNNINFTGRSPPDMIDLIKNARWAINLTKESFGISTAECLCLWVPVLWYDQWATSELVDEKSWILIKSKNENEIIKAFNVFILKERDRKYISEKARRIFSQKQQN